MHHGTSHLHSAFHSRSMESHNRILDLLILKFDDTLLTLFKQADYFLSSSFRSSKLFRNRLILLIVSFPVENLLATSRWDPPPSCIFHASIFCYTVRRVGTLISLAKKSEQIIGTGLRRGHKNTHGNLSKNFPGFS